MWLMFSVMCTGGALFACLWVIGQPAVSQAALPPTEVNRHLLRWLWPWGRALAPVCEPFLPWTVRTRLQHRLQLAGLAASWTVAQFVASQVLAAMVAFSVC